MNTDDNAAKIMALMINAIDYANKHKLDLNNKEDLKKILNAVDPNHLSGLDLDEFTNLIQASYNFMEISAYRIERKKTKLSN